MKYDTDTRILAEIYTKLNRIELIRAPYSSAKFHIPSPFINFWQNKIYYYFHLQLLTWKIHYKLCIRDSNNSKTNYNNIIKLPFFNGTLRNYK